MQQPLPLELCLYLWLMPPHLLLALLRLRLRQSLLSLPMLHLLPKSYGQSLPQPHPLYRTAALFMTLLPQLYTMLQLASSAPLRVVRRCMCATLDRPHSTLPWMTTMTALLAAAVFYRLPPPPLALAPDLLLCLRCKLPRVVAGGIVMPVLQRADCCSLWWMAH